MITHLRNLQSDHADKSNTHLQTYVVVTRSPTLFPLLHCTSPWLFCNYQLVLLNLFPFFNQHPDTHPTPTPHIWQPSECPLYL